jgi:subtilisin family serine protease
MGALTPVLEKRLPSRIVHPVIIETLPGKLYDIMHEIRPYSFEIVRTLLDRITPPEVPFFFPRFMDIPRFNMLACILPREVIEDYAVDDRVVKIYPDDVVYAFQYPTVPLEGVYVTERRIREKKKVTFTSTYWTKKLIGCDVANEKGFMGKGVKVAVLDTGSSAVHEMLRGRIQYPIHSPYPLPTVDTNGHGSWCSACVGGRRAVDEVLSRLSGRTVLCEGMAPESTIIPIKVLDFVVGMGSNSSIIKGVEIALEMGVDVLSLSLGGKEEANKEEDDPHFKVFEEAKRQGVIPCVAAGNDGPDENTVGSPASLSNVLSVGAYDPITGEIAKYSSRGPTNWGSIKPDVVTPGGGYPQNGIDNAIVNMLDMAGDGTENRFSPIQGTCLPSDIDLGGVTMKEISLGDTIKAFNNNAIINDVVLAKWYQGENITYEIELEDGRTIRATPEHKILVRRNNELIWVEVKDLKKGDEVVVENSKLVKVKKVQKYAKEKVYDITTLTHNFLANSIVVHNSMATPHCAGLVALMRECHKRVLGKILELDEIIRMMASLGHPKTNTDGYGLISWSIYERWLETEYSVRL